MTTVALMSQQIDCHIYHRVLPQSIPQRLWPRGTLLQTTITKSILWTVNRVQLEMSYSKFECIFELFKLRLQWENPFCNRSKIMSFYDHRAYCCIERSEPFNNTLLLKNTKKCYSSGIRSWDPRAYCAFDRVRHNQLRYLEYNEMQFHNYNK